MGTLSRQRLGVQVFRRELHTYIYIYIYIYIYKERERERERESFFLSVDVICSL